MEATMRYWTRPVHRLTLDHCFKPVLTSCTSHQIHTFKVHPPPSSTSVQSSLCLVTVSEQIVEKRSCGEDIFIHIQPCQFPLPWQIFKTKAHYTFNIKTGVVWWTVKYKINCCCQKKIDINIILGEVVFILMIFLFEVSDKQTFRDWGLVESNKIYIRKSHAAKCITNTPDNKMKTEVNIAFCILHLRSLVYPLAVALLTSYLRLNAISTMAAHQDEWQVYRGELYQLKGSGASLCFLL